MLNCYLVHTRNAALRWFKFHSVGTSPLRRSAHAMASDGTRVFVLGGYSPNARADKISLVHVFDTSMYVCLQFIWTALQVENTEDIKYPEPERNAVNPSEKTTQLAQKGSVPPTQEQPQGPKSSSSEAHDASSLENASPGHAASLQFIHERKPGPNGQPLEHTNVNSKPRRVPEGDVSETSTEFHAKFAAPRSSSEGEATRLEVERQPSVSLAVQTERDQRVAWLSDELALKNSLLEQAEANAAEAARLAGSELREYMDDQRLMWTSLVEQRDAELVDMQARLDELLLSRDKQIRQYEKKLTNVHTKLKAKESELEAVRLRLTDAEKGWTKSKAEADKLRAQAAESSVNKDEDQVTRRLMERVRALEVEVTSKRWNDKSIGEMECRNEG